MIHFEKLWHNPLEHFSDACNSFTDYQYGFKKSLTTQHALLAEKEYIIRSFHENKVAFDLFLHFTKTFDYLHHGIFFTKFEQYGIRGVALKLLKSYLSHRKQYVSINGYSPGTHALKAGVPQGSIVGPLLFCFYVNDVI